MRAAPWGRMLLAVVLAAAGLAPVGAVGAAGEVAPSVTGIAVTSDAGADATYALGESIEVSVTFSEAVDVTGAPRLKIDMDPAFWGEKNAAYGSGSGTTSLTFTHEVVEPNFSTQGIAVLADSLELNGGTIKSASSQTAAALSHTGLAHDANHKVDWRLSPPSPTATGVAVSSDAGDDDTYALGETIEMTVTFSEAVNVTGTPRLSIDMDPAFWGEKRAVYASGSGTTSLTFTHEVVEPNFSTQGIAVLADTLELNGGTIKSASSQTDAALSHAGLAHNADHKVNWQQSPEAACALSAPSSVSALGIERGAVVSWTLPDDLADTCEVSGFTVGATNDAGLSLEAPVIDPAARKHTIRGMDPGDYRFYVRIDYAEGTSDELRTAEANSVPGACITFAVKPYSGNGISGKITSVNGTGCMARTMFEIQMKDTSNDHWGTYGRFRYSLNPRADEPDFIFYGQEPYVGRDFRIRAYDASDSQYVSNTDSATIVSNDPTATADANSPGNLRVAAHNDSNALATWDLPSVATGRTLSAYIVEWKTGTDAAMTETIPHDTSGTSDFVKRRFRVNGLTDGKSYVVRVAARTHPNGSPTQTSDAWSLPAPAVKAWSEPTRVWFDSGRPQFHATIDVVFLSISSNKVGTGICRVNLSQVNCPIQKEGDSGGTLVNLGVTGTIDIRGTNTPDSGRSAKTIQSVGDENSVSAPAARASGGNGSLHVVWDEVTINPGNGHGIGAIDAYIVQRRKQNANGTWPNWATGTTKSATDRSHTFTGQGDGTYQVRVAARDNADDGDPMTMDVAIRGFTSNVIEVTLATSTTTTVPTGQPGSTIERSDGKGDVGIPHRIRVRPGARGSGKIIVEWEQPRRGAAAFGYQVRHRTDGGAWTTSDVLYPHQVKRICIDSCVNPRRHEITGLTLGTEYEVEIRVNNLNANGTGKWVSRSVRTNNAS